MSDKEEILSQIKFKYFRNNSDKGHKSQMQDKPCYYCRKKFERIGSILDAYTNKPKMVCEDCAIWAYKYQEGFKTKRAAAARRRRIFDVNYFMQEMVIDLYLEKHNLKTIDDLPEGVFENLGEQSKDVYNSFYSKEDKIKLEELPTQEEIEKELKKSLAYINL